MNFLAHIFLSGEDKKMQLGNFIGDAVKGSAYNKYPPAIANGILLHRAIDAYTDSHPLIKETVQSLKPYFGRYSGVILDIYFDYLLASRFDEFSEISLRRYTRRFYFTMIRNYRNLPGRIRRFMWHFIFTDRLGKYATTDGIKDSLEIMVLVHKMDISPEKAIGYLVKNEKELFDMFRLFFSELLIFSKAYMQTKEQAGF